MKKIISLLTLAIVVILTSCEKSNLVSVEETIATPQLVLETNEPVPSEETQLSLELQPAVTNNAAAQTRSSQLVYSNTASVGQGNIWYVWAYSSFFQAGYKYTAYITPLSGNPDLYIYRYSPWTYLRGSFTNAIDASYLANGDFSTSSQRGYYIIYGRTSATFNIEIYKEPLPAPNTDDYPYPAESACHANNECDGDAWNFCEDNCTSWVAWKVNQAQGYTNLNLPANNYPFYNGMTSPALSHAKNWDTRLANVGYTVNNSPEPGCIAQWDETTSNPYGHVAYVHSVSSIGTVTISEYNHSVACEYTTRTIASSSTQYPDNFIHILD